MTDILEPAIERTIPRDRVRELGEQVLCLLGDRLRPECLSEETVERYARAFERFKSWARYNGFKAMPAQGEVVAAYLIALMDATASIAKVEEAAEAIVHAHENRGRHIDPVFICAAITWARDAWEGARILNGGQL